MKAFQRAMFLTAAANAFVVGGCAEGTMPYAGGNDSAGEETDGGTGAGRDGGTDATSTPSDDAAPTDGASTSSSTKLILTEVVMTPSQGELVEIANPSGSPIDLSTYYLSDSGHYFRTPAGPPTVENTDFVVQFPAGTTIPAHGVITVAIDTAANYSTTYGTAPTLALTQMTPVVINGVPSLTNGGEIVVLFKWDGSSDLVNDVDMMIVGAPAGANGLIDKSGITLDGPDANTTGSAYKQDAETLMAQPATPGQNKSTKRVAPEATFQTQVGTGNGMSGDDETSENTALTWDTTFTAPTPGVVPAGLL